MHSNGDGIGLCQQLAQEGHEVVIYFNDKKMKRCYDGLLWKTDDWETAAGQAEIVIFDGNGNGTRAEGLRDRGLRVWNGGRMADALEKDRGLGMRVFEKAGIPTPETFFFKGPKDAEEIVKGNFKPSDRMVIKLDDFGACATSYVAKNRDDMLQQIESWVEDPKLARIDKGGIIQRFVEGVEISIEGWFNGVEFMYPFNVTMEDKPLLNEGKGPNTGCSQNVVWNLRAEHPRMARMIEPLAPLLRRGKFVGQIDVNTIVADDGSGPYALEFCYSDDTEVLTHSGWRRMADVREGEIVAGLDDTRTLVYVPVEKTTRLDWTGKKVIHIKSANSYDLVVTPNHNMVIQDKDGNLTTKPAKKLVGKGERTVRTSGWRGLEIPSYTIPLYWEKHQLGKHKKTAYLLHAERTVDMFDWCAFLGLFIAEGNVHRAKGGPYQVCVTQLNRVEDCERIISKIGFPYRYDGKRFTINSVQLGSHLDALLGTSKCWAKRMPRFILDLAPKFIMSFLYGFHVGDGSTHKRSLQRTFYTTSQGLADDLGECLLRCGAWYRITKRIPGTGSYGERPCYVVSERTKKKDGRIFPKRHCHTEEYTGDVVCLIVPHHRLYVRRPGGPAMWCANTPRPGYDATSTLIPSLEGYGVAIQAALAGEKKLPLGEHPFWFFTAVRGWIPPYPFESTRPSFNGELYDQIAGVPIEGWNAEDRSIVLYDAMLDADKLQVAGTSGIPFVALGSGKHLEDAVKSCYDNLHRIHVPNLGYRTDLGHRVSEGWDLIQPWLH